MNPLEFAEYWNLSPQQLATVLGISPATIYQWNTTGVSRRVPDKAANRQTLLIHLTWLRWLMEDQHLPPHIREVYEEIRDQHLSQPICLNRTTDDAPNQASD